MLVVDDEELVADTYAVLLENRYETHVDYGGEAALEAVDESVDAVLLDRRMPDVDGDEVLARIRDRGLTCKVIMATAVDPDLNILEMDFDDYLCKPIDQETLVDTLDHHVDSTSPAREGLDEFFSLVSKLSVLEAEQTATELEASAEYDRLTRRAEELERDLRKDVADFDDIVETYREIDRSS